MSSFFVEVENCGQAPWCVFLVVNMAPNKDSAHQTEIRIHSSPEVVEYVQNKIYANNREIWHVIMSIGHFHVWDKAVHFAQMWLDEIRGFRSRITKGFQLFHQYKDKENLTMYITPERKEKVIEELIKSATDPTSVYSIISQYDVEAYGEPYHTLASTDEQVRSGRPKLIVQGQERTLGWIFSIET